MINLTSDFFTTVERLFHDWNYGHPKILYGLIRALKPEVCVEVGTYRGYAACYMARALQENNYGHLYCMDNFSLTDHTSRYGDPEQHWIKNLTECGVMDWVTLLKGDSAKTMSSLKHVDFAYIDGWHSYIQAKIDFDSVAKLGATTICMDDTLNCIGPRKVVYQLDRNYWNVITLANDNGISICVRPPQRRVTFSQELPNHPGTDITAYTDDQIQEHLKQASKQNSVNYSLE